jgi:hypothetical protein
MLVWQVQNFEFKPQYHQKKKKKRNKEKGGLKIYKILLSFWSIKLAT